MIKTRLKHYLAWFLNKPLIRSITPASWYLSIRYYEHLGKKLNLKNPVTFNEKLQWLKIYNHKPEYTILVAKYAVRQYISKTIGKEYLIPLAGGPWDKFDDIEFEQLPDQFVLKCTHDSASVVICKDKYNFDKEKARQKINAALKYNFYWYGREWPYKNVKPKIIAEKFMVDDCGDPDLKDYKFMCFNGVVKCSFVCTERFSGNLRVTFFDRDWNTMPFSRTYPVSEKEIPKPVNYNQMLELAEQLSQDIPFIRVDFYEINGKIYFGELTFFPGCGFEAFHPESWDKKLGDWIILKKQ